LNEFVGGYLIPMLREYGVIGIGAITLVESMGIPAPGESAVIAGALYAATTHEFGIAPFVASAAAGAILGDNAGYFLGRGIGIRLIRKYGFSVGLTGARIKLGRYLFHRYGSNMVFFGRFIAVLRTFTALLAGANRMEWKQFLVANALGGTTWASLYGFGAYFLGYEARRLLGSMAIGLGAIAAVVAVVLILALRRGVYRLQHEAELAFPDVIPEHNQE
jgi:membrane protein DedA with SNARE-associated domain